MTTRNQSQHVSAEVLKRTILDKNLNQIKNINETGSFGFFLITTVLIFLFILIISSDLLSKASALDIQTPLFIILTFCFLLLIIYEGYKNIYNRLSQIMAMVEHLYSQDWLSPKLEFGEDGTWANLDQFPALKKKVDSEIYESARKLSIITSHQASTEEKLEAISQFNYWHILEAILTEFDDESLTRPNPIKDASLIQSSIKRRIQELKIKEVSN